MHFDITRARPALVGAFILAMAATPGMAGAQANTHVGMRIGYNFDAEEVLLGGSLTVPMTSRIWFYPSLEIYTPDRGNRIGFNGDVKIHLPRASATAPAFYAGGGIGVQNRNVGEFSNTDLGVNLLFGLESIIGWIHPFGEARVLLYDRSQFVILAGVNVTLGSR